MRLSRCFLLIISLLLWLGCTRVDETVFVPDLNVFIQVRRTPRYVFLLFSNERNTFSTSPMHEMDFVQIPRLGPIPVSYYTLFCSKERKDTLWHKQGVKANSITIPMKEISGPHYDGSFYEQKLFPLQYYYSFQVCRGRSGYFVHIQNNAGVITHLEKEID